MVAAKRKILEINVNKRRQTMNNIGLAKQAYVGPPKALTKSYPLGNDNQELRKAESHWSYKSKKVRRKEIIDSL